MKKFKIILSLFITITSVSCSSEALDYNKCLEKVKLTFPKAKIYNAIGYSKYKFVVADSNNLFLVETMNFNNANVSEIHLLKLQ